MTGLHGWEAGALWEDTQLAANHVADIERIARVGETRDSTGRRPGRWGQPQGR
jgi:hypothetical protein